MHARTPQLVNSEQVLALSPIPIWVLDIDAIRIVWANPAALEFWEAGSIEELIQRDMLTKAPDAVLVRLRQTIHRLRSGESFQEDWTFFPKGKPMPVVLHLDPILLHDGRLGMLNQAMKVEEHATSSIVRALATARHAKSTIVFVDALGSIYTQNAGSILEFGETTSWVSWIAKSTMATEILRNALAGKTVEVETMVHSLRGKRVHTILAHELRDPVSGDTGVLIQHFDVTERVEAERLVQAQLSKLREQQREILALSTPFLDVGANTLALPLIGRIDESRAAEITSRLLEMVASRGIERVIIDMTGITSVDSSSITFLLRLFNAVTLLGAKPIVTGIRSDLARMLAASDENFSEITIKHSLADGLTEGRASKHLQNHRIFPT